MKIIAEYWWPPLRSRKYHRYTVEWGRAYRNKWYYQSSHRTLTGARIKAVFMLLWDQYDYRIVDTWGEA